ncbi:MAG: SseB family protein [Kineosporiaceae bacterium]|nr:SseB family protein [Kineosporiaceae bacterium]
MSPTQPPGHSRHIGPRPGAPGEGPTDSHGLPWSGRTLNPQPFAGDPGDGDPQVLAALAAHATGTATEREVLAALAPARLLVPIVAVVGEGHPMPDHVRGDAGAEMSIPLLAGPAGTRALPAFTSVLALAAWDAEARPSPVEASRAALSAVDEDCTVMVIDPGSVHAFVVRRPPLWALAQGRTWTPPAEDGELAEAVRGALGLLPAVRAVRLEPGRRRELDLVLTLEPGLDAAGLKEVLSAVSHRLAGVTLLAERAESVELRPVAAIR